MRVARCPRCHRYRVVVGIKRPRLRQHHAQSRLGAPLCPGSGLPVPTIDLHDLQELAR
ncbi:hypothetical protein [Nocardioides pakistanensis]